MRTPKLSREHSLLAVKLGVSAAWIVAVFYLLVTSVPANVLMPTAENRNQARLLMPEGFAFFTRDPQEPDIYLYRDSGEQITPIDGRAYRAVPLAGLDRAGRIERGAVSSLAKNLPERVFSECRDEVWACARASAAEPIQLSTRPGFFPTCGALVLERKKPTPWMWYRRNPQLRMPSQIVKVMVPC